MTLNCQDAGFFENDACGLSCDKENVTVFDFDAMSVF